MAKEMNLLRRLRDETPKFFKRVLAMSITLSAVGAAVLAAPNVITGFTLSDTIIKYCQWAIVAGLAAGVVAKSTVEPEKFKNEN